MKWHDLIKPSALEGWMDLQGLGKGPVEELVQLSGGTQNILVRFRRSGRTFVLRRPPLHPRPESNASIRREIRILRALAGTAIPHPRIIATSEDDDIIGVAFYLMDVVDGFNPTDALPEFHQNEAVQHEMGLKLVDGIVSLGTLDYKVAGLAGFGKPDTFLERQAPRWSAQLETYRQFAEWPGPEGLPGVTRLSSWLQANRPATFEPGILHGDYHIGNVMFCHHSSDLAAVVDWELCTIGDPLVDLGWLLATWPTDGFPVSPTLDVQPWLGFPPAQELAARYRAQSSRDLSALDWYVALACYKLGIILEGTFARACAGVSNTETGAVLHRAAVHLFEKAARLTH